MSVATHLRFRLSETVHDFSGFWPAIHITDSLSLPTYFLMISLALCLSLLWLVKRVEARNLPRIQAVDLALVVMISGFIGSRLFHVFFEEPHYYAEQPLRVFFIWRGGFVWYGGAILGGLAGWFYLKRKAIDAGPWLDVFAPLCAFGYALGRVACWFTGCCFGEVCVLPMSISQWISHDDVYRFRQPTQLTSVFFELAVLAFLLRLERRSKWARAVPGRLFAVWVSLHSFGRILMEIFRADPRGPEPLGVSISTWISFVLLISAGTWLWRSHRRSL